ncbi:hypothetical protein C5167_032588 [Papaver somniferum]|uniref:Secreted protein n=1 Tax=Papaver somniferum TaxID=3469 RepID=A0A4Y7K9L7_PAPSO|nr:hypothetical protein C5167_032588 [Papaver somniferum]
MKMMMKKMMMKSVLIACITLLLLTALTEVTDAARRTGRGSKAVAADSVAIPSSGDTAPTRISTTSARRYAARLDSTKKALIHA